MRVFTKTKSIGALIALVLGLVTWVVSHDAIASLSLGILVEIVALLFEINLSIIEEFEKFGQASRLRSLLPAGDRNGPDLLQYVEAYNNVTQDSHPIIAQYARERALESVDEMNGLREGRMEIGQSLVQVKGTDILRGLRVSGFATALGHLYDFWLPEAKQSNSGDASMREGAAPGHDQNDMAGASDAVKRGYQQQGLDAARRRNIPITRVFLLERDDVLLPGEFIKLIDDQKNAGIRVLTAYLDGLPAELGKDFGIWDDRIVAYVNWEHSVVSGPNREPILASTITGATYYTTATELLRARRMRDRILQRAVAWETVRNNHVTGRRQQDLSRNRSPSPASYATGLRATRRRYSVGVTSPFTGATSWCSMTKPTSRKSATISFTSPRSWLVIFCA